MVDQSAIAILLGYVVDDDAGNANGTVGKLLPVPERHYASEQEPDCGQGENDEDEGVFRTPYLKVRFGCTRQI